MRNVERRCQETFRPDVKKAEAFAREFFGDGDFLAFGIDGSIGYHERLQMMLFYANATAYSCPFHVGRDIAFDPKSVKRSAALSSSAAVPLWSEDFSEVMPKRRRGYRTRS